MSALADALNAYCHAIACNAPSIDRADRLQDLLTAGKADIAELVAAEEAVARVWDRVLPAIEVDA